MNGIIIEIAKDELHQLVHEAVRTALAELNISSSVMAEQGDENLLDVDGALHILKKMKKATLYQKTHKKQIPHIKKGKFLYFNKKELLDWVQEGKVPTEEE